jgi:hypothetical protein
LRRRAMPPARSKMHSFRKRYDIEKRLLETP